MIVSMTGFGRSEKKSSYGPIRVEIKTVNHKYFEVSTRIPGYLNEYEDLIRRTVLQEAKRGKVNVFISCPDPAVFSSKLRLNEPLAKEVFNKMKRLEHVLGLKISAKDAEDSRIITEVMRFPDVITKDVAYGRSDRFARELEQAVLAAVKSLKSSRLQEGRALEKDIRGRLFEIAKALSVIEKRLPILAKEYRVSLEKRMKEYLKNASLDHERLTLEVAMYVKNSDISEEITRMKSHIDGMKRTLGESGELGRKIDFIGQEMTREANTMGSKSNDVVIANEVIKIKSTIEKIREQAQNVE